MGARALSAPQSSPHPRNPPGPGPPPSCCYDNQFCEDVEIRIGTKEARRAPGTEDPSFNSCAGSSTSVHSFTDDLGYQGSRELSSEEEPSLAPARRQKRSLRKHKGEKDEHEEDEADRGPMPRRSWRPRQKERPSPRAPGSSSGGLAPQSPASRWSLAGLRRCLCGCCCAHGPGRGLGSGAPRPDG